MNKSLFGIVVGLTWFAAGLTTDAGAAEGVKRVGVQLGFAGLANEGSFAGFGGGLSAGYAITDAWTLSASATVSSNVLREDGKRGQVFAQSVGAIYALDILHIVPYFGVFAGLYEMRDPTPATKAHPEPPGTKLKGGAQLALGVDWIHSRDLTFGLEIRGHALPQDFLKSPDNPTPFYATTFVKAEYTWGWF